MKLLSTTDFCFLHLGCPLRLCSTVTTLCSVGLALLVTLTTKTYEDAMIPPPWGGNFSAFVKLRGHPSVPSDQQQYLALGSQGIFKEKCHHENLSMF